MNAVNPKKLLLSKWTAVRVVDKQKHFLVSDVILPELPDEKVEWVEIEAVYSGQKRRIAWAQLRDKSIWRQGWQ
ncbi:MAG: TIGR02450 family Trp-rich protein [bacterium]|nr:TIGR02450 family Trp-rich protein [bacterium]